MRLRLVFQLMVLSLLGLAVVSAAQSDVPSETGTVEGVVAIDGAPLSDVRVVVSCTARSDYEGRAVSDDTGSFTVSEIPLGGFYVAVFNAADELVAEGEGTLENAGETVTVELNPVS